ncbi:uncharacterized protein LOC131805424 [Musca domestica]|uniref:Uncharacterized protein LOC131805424 n=1 Tax=Musca domestica TaxID=7370 RepID=A0ABM3VFH3_MUSDO|nr:uncharacterized protein LOC131805424 [Musca domestica]
MQTLKIPKLQNIHTNSICNFTISRKRLPSIFRKRSDKLKRELEDAVREPNSSFTHHRNSSGSSIHGGAGGDAYDDSDRDTLSGDHNIETGCDAEMYGSPQDPFHTGGMGSYMKSANPTNIYMKFEATKLNRMRYVGVRLNVSLQPVGPIVKSSCGTWGKAHRNHVPFWVAAVLVLIPSILIPPAPTL